MISKLSLLLLFAINCFGLVIMPNIPQTIVYLVIIAIANKSLFKYTPYNKIILIILIGIILSFIPALMYRNQSIIDTFRASVHYYQYIIFFAILSMKPTIKQVEKSLEYICIFAVSIYIIQYILTPYGILIIESGQRALEATNVEGERFRISGSAIFALMYFYGINKYVIFKRIWYLLIALINIVPIILMGFRTMLAMIVLFTIVLVIILNKKHLYSIFKYILISGTVIILLLQVPAISSRVEYMIDKQTNSDDTFTNSDYIRYRQLYYFFNEYPKSDLDRILGSGSAFPTTQFGRENFQLGETGLIWVDLGLIGLICILGPFTVLAMLWLCFRAIKINRSNNTLYISIFLVYLIMVSFTTMEFYRSGNFIIQSVAFYIAYKTYMQNQKNIFNEKSRNLNIS